MLCDEHGIRMEFTLLPIRRIQKVLGPSIGKRPLRFKFRPGIQGNRQSFPREAQRQRIDGGGLVRRTWFSREDTDDGPSLGRFEGAEGEDFTRASIAEEDVTFVPPDASQRWISLSILYEAEGS